MDHAEAIETEGHAPQNEIADNIFVRENGTEPTAESIAEGGDAMDANDQAYAGDETYGYGSMDADSANVDEGSLQLWDESGLGSAAAAEPSDTTSSLMSTLAATTTGHSHVAVAGGSDTSEQPTFVESVTPHRVTDSGKPLDGGPPAAPPGGSTAGDKSEPDNSFTPRPSASHPGTLSEQSSFDQGQDMSVDEEENHSDKASSVDAQQSETDTDVPLPQDHRQSGQGNERSPFENFYGPFTHTTDTCLADARERLHVALEQTRLLRASFTDQAYERYRCVMKPVPDSLNEIVSQIHSDPNEAASLIREQVETIKTEKETEKKHAQQNNVGLEEIAYFGEGLHLVVLPEDGNDETEIDPAQFPHRGPTNPKTGERREEISAAAAATTEQVFERIRRIRAIRQGVDILPGAGITDEVTQMTRNPVQDLEAPHELFSPSDVTGPLASSPAPSVDNNTVERSSKGLRHLLTLAPDAEGARPDGGFTAVQSALIARGVGLNEMNRDSRINSLRQRIFHPNHLPPTPSYKFLPPLLGPHQLHRLQAADARKEGLGIVNSARESIKSVVEGFYLSARKDQSLTKDSKPKHGDDSSSGIAIALGEENSASEIDLLRRMCLPMLENPRDKNDPADLTAETTCPSNEFSHSGSDMVQPDPLLAFSVMSAVGLVRRKEGNFRKLEPNYHPDPSSENAYAQALGLASLTGLESVSEFFQTHSGTGNGRKRRLSGNDSALDDATQMKMDTGYANDRDAKDEVVYQIRGGGGQDELNAFDSRAVSKEARDGKKQKKNGVSQSKSNTDAHRPDPSLTGYAGYDPLYNAMSQVPLGDKQSRSVIAAAASRQLLQHQLGVHPDPYHNTALAHQLALPPIGSRLSSLSASDLSDFYLRNGLAGNPDWSALRNANPAAAADVLAQHPHLRNSLGLLQGQLNLSLPEQEAARNMLLRERHNAAAAARAHEAVTAAAAARYQAALSSINPHPFGFAPSSLTQPHPTETQSISSLPAFHAKQQRETSSQKLQRRRSLSLSENSSHNKNNKEVRRGDFGESDQLADTKRPASAPPSPPSPPSPPYCEIIGTTTNGGLNTDTPTKKIIPGDKASISERGFAVPNPPKGLHQKIADLIAHAKFHKAYAISQQKSDESKALLIKFLLSLGAAVPIHNESIAVSLETKLSSSCQSCLHEFVGNSSSASASREVIIAVISIWLWTEHQDCFKQTLDERKKEADSIHMWLVNLAVDKSLSALATFYNSHPSGKRDGSTKGTSNEQVAAIASESLIKEVFVDSRADATFPILEDLLKLLDSLRTDALRVKTQERVLLAALTSRCGNMSEAFSNSYVSSIVRAGVALGHENVCEIGQNEECRASTLLPYDFFHDNVGVWEEPCRPTTGYHAGVGGDQLKRQAHARAVIQKSMKMLQNRFSLKGGISDGGPYFPLAPTNASAPSPTTSIPPLVRTSSGSLKRRGPHDATGVSGTGPSDTVFNPDHSVLPMIWKPNSIANFPYGEHELECPTGMSENKRRKISQLSSGTPEDQAASLSLRHRSTEELEWEDVANMFFHGGSTRNIDINYDFGSNAHLGKTKIFAPFVRALDPSSLEAEIELESELSSDEDISDEAVLQRHQDVLDEMKLKLDSAFETRKQHSQPRGRKR